MRTPHAGNFAGRIAVSQKAENAVAGNSSFHAISLQFSYLEIWAHRGQKNGTHFDAASGPTLCPAGTVAITKERSG